MKHLRIATYEIKKGSFQELADVTPEQMLREFQRPARVHPVRPRRHRREEVPVAEPVGDAQGRR